MSKKRGSYQNSYFFNVLFFSSVLFFEDNNSSFNFFKSLISFERLYFLIISFLLCFTFSSSTHRTLQSHPLAHYQQSLSIQYSWHLSPCRRYAQHLKDAQASGHCYHVLGKFLLTFPVCSTFHCMSVSSNRYHQHLT